MIASEGPRMMSLAARYADGWQAGWSGLPNAAFRDERARLDAACAAEGRTRPIDVLVGIEVERPRPADDAAPAARRIGHRRRPRAWQAEGVDHVQLGVHPGTHARPSRSPSTGSAASRA